MPNLANVLKEEISRLSRKEVRSATAGLAKSNATLRTRPKFPSEQNVSNW